MRLTPKVTKRDAVFFAPSKHPDFDGNPYLPQCNRPSHRSPEANARRVNRGFPLESITREYFMKSSMLTYSVPSRPCAGDNHALGSDEPEKRLRHGTH